MRAIILLGLLCSFLSAEPREALLIGNKNYNYLENLQNPRPSIKELKKALKKLGFHVVDRYDLDAENLSAEVEKFRDRLSSDTIGFFYYSGHGCQLNNQSYLVPTNVDTTKPSKVRYHALSIGELLDTLNRANNKVNMLFLDACRDVPIGAKGGKKGLGQINTTPKGTLVVYATEAGKTANDNTLFINELRKTLLTPNKKLWEIGNTLSNSVANKTNDEQIPETFSKKLPSRLVLLEGGYVPSKPDEPVYVPTPVVEEVKPSTSKWITPKDSVCRANGGEIDADWVCTANLENSKKICSASGGRLPAIEELKSVVTDCGGIITSYRGLKDLDKNKNNSQYQKCYKKRGFVASNSYWSSTPHSGNSYAWIVSFYTGHHYNGTHKNNRLHVRCVRDGQ